MKHWKDAQTGGKFVVGASLPTPPDLPRWYYRQSAVDKRSTKQAYAYEQLMGRKPPKLTGLAEAQFSYNPRIKRFRGVSAAELASVVSEPYCPWCTDGIDAPAEECCGFAGCNPEAESC